MSDISPLDKPVVVIGAAAVDAKARAPGGVVRGTSVPGRIRMSVGGVARNIAECLARLEVPTIFFSAVGDDMLGTYILEHSAHAGVDVSPTLKIQGARTSSYFALIEPDGSLGWSIDDMAVLGYITPEAILAQEALIAGARSVVLDNNLPLPSLETAITLCKRHNISICADPTSRYLAPRFIPFIPSFNLIAPNQQEAAVLCDCTVDSVDDALRAAQKLVHMGVRMALVTLGDMGVVYATTNERGHIGAPEVDVVDLTGGSDAMTATVVYALLHDFPVDEAVRLAVTAAMLTITSQDTVPDNLSLELLYDSLVV